MRDSRSKQGRLGAVIASWYGVNGWTAEDAGSYLEAVFEQWAARSRHDWSLDLAALTDHYDIDPAQMTPPGGDGAGDGRS